MRKSLEIISPFFNEFSSRDSRFPSHSLQKFERLSNEIATLIRVQVAEEDVGSLTRTIQDLIAVSYNNGVKEGRKVSVKKPASPKEVQGKIIHRTRDFRD